MIKLRHVVKKISFTNMLKEPKDHSADEWSALVARFESSTPNSMVIESLIDKILEFQNDPPISQQVKKPDANKVIIRLKNTSERDEALKGLKASQDLSDVYVPTFSFPSIVKLSNVTGDFSLDTDPPDTRNPEEDVPSPYFLENYYNLSDSFAYLRILHPDEQTNSNCYLVRL